MELRYNEAVKYLTGISFGHLKTTYVIVIIAKKL